MHLKKTNYLCSVLAGLCANAGLRTIAVPVALALGAAGEVPATGVRGTNAARLPAVLTLTLN